MYSILNLIDNEQKIKVILSPSSVLYDGTAGGCALSVAVTDVNKVCKLSIDNDTLNIFILNIFIK